jgi:phospholipid/cholesterol/gamma-HCH transport system ATP-binding protein
MGLSGAGKSTLLKCIAGLLQPTSGKLFIGKTNIVGLPERRLNPIRRKIGMVFQNGALFDSLNVYDNVSFGLRRHFKMSEEEISEVVHTKLNMVGMSGTEKLMASQLSGGMQKGVALARALAMDPEIVLYDEPTAGLDPITSATVANLIMRTRDNLGVTSVLVSHDITTIKRVSSRMALLHRGVITAEGTPKEMDASDDPVVKQFLMSVINRSISKWDSNNKQEE